MTLTFRHVRIAQLGVEASLAAVDNKAPGPFGGIGRALGYEDIFVKALAGGDGSAPAWSGKSLHGNRFWKKYATGKLTRISESKWPQEAWKRLVPIKILEPLPALQLHPVETRRWGEAFAWPTGFGLCWNNWLEGTLGAEDLTALLGRLCNGEVDWSGPGGGGRRRVKALYHDTLDQLGETIWAAKGGGIRSGTTTIVTIVRGAASRPREDPALTLKPLLDGIAEIWGSRPSPAPGDIRAESGQTVYVADGLRLVWLPDSFLAGDRIHRCGCLHRNLIASTMQVEMLAATAQLLAEVRKDGGPSPAHAPLLERLKDRIEFFVSGSGYSAPFLSGPLERGPVKAAREALFGK